MIDKENEYTAIEMVDKIMSKIDGSGVWLESHDSVTDVTIPVFIRYRHPIWEYMDGMTRVITPWSGDEVFELISAFIDSRLAKQRTKEYVIGFLREGLTKRYAACRKSNKYERQVV